MIIHLGHKNLSQTGGPEHYLVYRRPKQIPSKWEKQITMLVFWHVSSANQSTINLHNSDTHRFVDRCLSIVTIVSLVLKDDLTGTQAGAGFVSKSNIQ